MAKSPKTKKVESLTHDKARRINVPTAELQSLADQQEEADPRPPKHYPRARPLPNGETRERDPDLDPQIVWNGVKISLTKDQAAQLAETGTVEIGDAQLVWRGKDRQDWSDLVVNVPMLYVQEKVHPKAIIDDLKRQSEAAREASSDAPDLFADFNGLIDPEARAEFYQHAMHWQNRMILGDSLQVMASLTEREAQRGKVQCIYFDPPYGIKFNSNWQVSTLSRDVKDGKVTDVTREPEQVKAFRDTWRDRIHSYLTYLRDRLTVARELLAESGSIFVQIGDENVHRIRVLLDEIFGNENFCSQIVFRKTTGKGSALLDNSYDSLVWYAKDRDRVKYRELFNERTYVGDENLRHLELEDGSLTSMSDSQLAGLAPLPVAARVYHPNPLTSARASNAADVGEYYYQGRRFAPGTRTFSTNANGLNKLALAGRLVPIGGTLRYKRYLLDFPLKSRNDIWDETRQSGFANEKIYVVQTATGAVEACVLMTTDPGDVVFDPTCGSGTTAYVAEQWGRRWITVDTSRVALALARTRLMSARYTYYLLADSPEGRQREQEVTGRIQPDTPTRKDIRQGFVYERVPHITLKSIANNAEIDVIWGTWQRKLEPLREALNARLKRNEPWEEWQIPREAGDPWPEQAAKQHAIAIDTNASEKRRLAALAKINKELSRKYTLETLPERNSAP